MTDHERLEAAWRAFEAANPQIRGMTVPVRGLIRQAFRAAWLAAELFYRREPA